MVEFSPRMGWSYPSRDDDPWYDPFVDFIQGADASAFAAREDRSVIWSGGGTLSWSAGSSTLTWTGTISVYSPLGGRLLQIAAGSVSSWAEGEVVYLSLVRQASASTTVALSKALQVPSDDNAMALGVRIGNSIFFRTGISLGDGDSADGLAPVPGTGGGTDPNAIHVNVASEISGIALKAAPTTSDLLVLEDAADGNNKKRTTIGDLPAAAPALHASTHQSGGGDAIKLDDLAAPDDNTDLDATTGAHGLLPKLGGGTTNFLRADGSWATPSGGAPLSDTAPVDVDPQAASAGVASEASRQDHKHDIVTATAGAATPGDSAAEGTANSLARSDHQHSLPAFGTTTGTFCEGDDSRLSDARTPTAHATTHEPGGGDAMAVDAAAATGSLRTLGTGAAQACAGNDSRLSDARTPTAHNTTHQSGGADAIKLDDLAAPDDNTDLDATVSAHGLLPKLGGGTTNYLRADGTWAAPPGGTDADAIHDNVAGEIAAITEKTSPVDADLILIEDSEDSNNKKRVQISNLPGGTATTAGTTSYRELATNALDTQGVSVVENDVGEGVFDAGLHQSVLFRATLTASWATTGTLEVKLYDDGPTSAPGTPRLVATLSKTADGGYEVFEQALTIVSSGASTNEVLGEARVYRVTIEVDGTTGDTGYIGSAGFVATGASDALAADQIQAIVMSLNA
jgi:hypothetical protein